jgi:hypothetical protein
MQSPFAWFTFPSDDAVRKVLERALLIKYAGTPVCMCDAQHTANRSLLRAVYRIWAHSDDVDGACEQLKALPAQAFV